MKPSFEDFEDIDHPLVKKTLAAHEDAFLGKGFEPTNYGADTDFNEEGSHIYSKLTKGEGLYSGGLETHHDYKTGKIHHVWTVKKLKGKV